MPEHVFDKSGIMSLHPAAVSVLTSAVAGCLVLRLLSNKLETFVECARRVVAAEPGEDGAPVSAERATFMSRSYSMRGAPDRDHDFSIGKQLINLPAQREVGRSAALRDTETDIPRQTSAAVPIAGMHTKITS